MKCDICGSEIKAMPMGSSYKLLPLIDLRSFPPRGVYACRQCLDTHTEDELAIIWLDSIQQRQQPHRPQSTLL